MLCSGLPAHQKQSFNKPTAPPPPLAPPPTHPAHPGLPTPTHLGHQLRRRLALAKPRLGMRQQQLRQRRRHATRGRRRRRRPQRRAAGLQAPAPSPFSSAPAGVCCPAGGGGGGGCQCRVLLAATHAPKVGVGLGQRLEGLPSGPPGSSEEGQQRDRASGDPY